jgi:hypothetical protein
MNKRNSMHYWLSEAEESLAKAVDISKDGTVPLHNMYMLAPIIDSERQQTKNEELLREMLEANDEQVKTDWSYDERSKEQYKFHFVSSYLFCFVVAGKIDEFKYDRIMEYVNSEMSLFTDGYGAE